MDIHLLNALGITNCALFKCSAEEELECLTPELPWLPHVVTLDEKNRLQKKHIPSIFLDDFFLDDFLRVANNVARNFYDTHPKIAELTKSSKFSFDGSYVSFERRLRKYWMG